MKRTLFAAVCLAMLLAACNSPFGPERPTCSRQWLNPFASCPSPSQPSSEDEDEPVAEAVGRETVMHTQLRTTDFPAVRRDLGGSLPAETAEEQDRRSRQLVPRSDSYLYTRLYVDFYEASAPADHFMPARCSGTKCVFTHFDGTTVTVDLSENSFVIGYTLLTLNGITIEAHNTADVTDYGQSYHSAQIGSTLHDSGFFSNFSYQVASDDYYGRSVRGSLAYGDRTGSAPSVSGTWRGMMTAVDKRYDLLMLGDAELRYSVSQSGGSLEAEFGADTPILSATKRHGEYHILPSIVFSNVQVRSDGTFNGGRQGNSIQGAFYGNAHAEATGVFESSVLLGAFGTKRAR